MSFQRLIPGLPIRRDGSDADSNHGRCSAGY